MKPRTLTVVAQLRINDVFKKPDCKKQWRIVSTEKIIKRRHTYEALAVSVSGGQVKPKAFKGKEQVVYLKTLVIA